MKKYLLLILLCLFGLNCYSQRFDETMQYLKSLHQKGMESKYAEALVGIAGIYSDTVYHRHYPEVANLLLKEHKFVKTFYGVDSYQYNNVLCCLDRIYLFSKYFKNQDTSCLPQIEKMLLSLENELQFVKRNKLDFLNMIFGIYLVKGNKKKIMKYAELKYNIAKNKGEEGFYYSSLDYIMACYSCKEYQRFQALITEMFSSPKFTLKQKTDIFVQSFLYLTQYGWSNECSQFLLQSFPGWINDNEALINMTNILSSAFSANDERYIRDLSTVIARTDILSDEDKINSLFMFASCYLQRKDQFNYSNYLSKIVEVADKSGEPMLKFREKYIPYSGDLALSFLMQSENEKAKFYLEKTLSDIENVYGIANESYSNYLIILTNLLENTYYNYGLAISYLRKYCDVLSAQNQVTPSVDYLELSSCLIHCYIKNNMKKKAKKKLDEILSLVHKNKIEDKDILDTLMAAYEMIQK